MKFGQTHVLKTAKGKIGVGLALTLFGAIAILAAPSVSDGLLCSLIALAGGVFIALGVRQDRTEKNSIRNSDKKAKK